MGRPRNLGHVVSRNAIFAGAQNIRASILGDGVDARGRRVCLSGKTKSNNLTVVVTVNSAEVAKLDFDMKNRTGKRTILLSQSLVASKEGDLKITLDYDDVMTCALRRLFRLAMTIAILRSNLYLWSCRPVANPSGPTRLFLEGRTCPEAGEQRYHLRSLLDGDGIRGYPQNDIDDGTRSWFWGRNAAVGKYRV
jgi:hypothetical protein